MNKTSSPPRLVGVHRELTPFERLDRASTDLGVELWVKREDLADDSGCGHKIRKLAYLLADARKRGATVVLTVASTPSGQAAGLAVHARRAGLRAHVVYCGDEQVRPVTPHGTYLVTALAGATVTWHERSSWQQWPEFLEQAAEAERRAGEVPYLVPPGMSAWPGIMGSIDLGRELTSQVDELEPRQTHIVAAAGSGGTVLGIALGSWANKQICTVHGVCIGATLEATTAELDGLRTVTAHRIRNDLAITVPVHLYDGARGRGYDQPTDVEFGMMRRGLTCYGLLLDSTYMVKTVLGLEKLIATGAIPRGHRVVLVHTGSAASFFNDHTALGLWAARELPDFTIHPAADHGTAAPIGDI